MRFIVRLSTNFDYNTVKNSWLTDYETSDKDIEEGEFYIELHDIEDIIKVSDMVGENIVVGNCIDEATIII